MQGLKHGIAGALVACLLLAGGSAIGVIPAGAQLFSEGGTMRNGKVTVTGSSTLIPTTKLGNRVRVDVWNNTALGGDDLYCEVNGTATTASSFPIGPKSGVSFDTMFPVACIRGGSTNLDVRYIERGAP